MAPEQLEGASGDERTDIFAFGAVLYEMASGRRAFRGDSQASLIAAILNGHPEPLASVQPTVPPALERLVGKCLAKDPDARWQSASDVADELRWIAGGEGSRAADVEGITPAPQGPMGRDRYRIAAGCCRRRGDLAVAQRGSSRRARGEAPTSHVQRRRRDVGAVPRWSHRGVRASRLRPSSGARA